MILKNNFVKAGALLLLCGSFAACSSKTKTADVVTPKSPSMEAKQVAVEQEASYVAEFSFAKGSSNLTEAAKADIRKLVESAKARGPIKEVKVITWGDSEYPSTNLKKLSSKEVNLVKKRNKAIEDYTRTVASGVDVDLHSMAERPGALKEFFNTEDVQLKRSLEVAGIPTTDTAVKVPSKSSKSIMMVLRGDK